MGVADHNDKAVASRFSSKTSIFASVFLVVVSLLGASSLEFQFSALPVNPSGSSPASFSSSVSPLGLQLRVAIDATAIGRYGTLRAQTEVVNTLDRNVSIALGQVNANISAWNTYDFFCAVNIA